MSDNTEDTQNAEETQTNVFQLLDGKKTANADALPQYPYVLEDVDGVFHELYGFPVFTPQYMMIMREFTGSITAPVFMTPIHRIKTFEFDDEFGEDDESVATLPF